MAVLGISLTGCGLLSTHEQCQELAEVLDRSKRELAEPLTANPPAQKLEARANTYRELATQLKGLKLDKELDKHRDLLVRHLQTIVQHLNHAADAVVQATKDNPKADRATADSAHDGPAAGTLRAKQRSQLRRYTLAKTEIDAASVKIAETMHKLNLDCH